MLSTVLDTYCGHHEFACHDVAARHSNTLLRFGFVGGSMPVMSLKFGVGTVRSLKVANKNRAVDRTTSGITDANHLDVQGHLQYIHPSLVHLLQPFLQ